MTRRLPPRFLAGVFALGFVFAVSCMAQEAGGGTESSEPEAIWKWANFIILAVGLGYLMAKTLPEFFRSRTEGIQRSIAEAQQTKLDAERRAAEMDARLAALESEIEKFRKQARQEIEREGERIRNETAAQIRRLEQQAEAEIEAAGKAARRELHALAARLALEMAEQRIRTRLSVHSEAALVDKFLTDLAREGSKN
ncbi:MAG TPA: ATP synthase F0 subunit B [Bryobacteraceae bacterium]|nr:ATP synthase F0 subunit B [Bryobacteraceae bacterium]